MPTYGSKNQPLVSTTDTFNPPTDINSATNWGATFANVRSVADTTALNALTGADRWAGLTAYKLDSNEFYTWNGSAWVLNPGVAGPPRIELTRTTGQSQSTGSVVTQTGWTVTANRGGFVHTNGVITIPRTGFYDLHANVSFQAATAGFREVRVVVNGAYRFRNNAHPVQTATFETNVQVNLRSYSFTAGELVRLDTFTNSGATISTTGATVPMKFIMTWAGE
jgi:hypothetical protein